jgi:hypothetical protein
MNDHERLRGALQAAVPDPPVESWQGGVARARASRHRRRKLLTAATLVVVATVVTPIALATRSTGPEPSHVSTHVPTGQGLAACRGLDRDLGLGTPIDVRTVDGRTAAEWLRQTTGDPVQGPPIDPSQVSGDPTVTVCVTSSKSIYRVVVIRPGARPVVDAKGDYRSIGAVMQPLDELWKGGAETTDAPFSCPGRSTKPTYGVSTSLPNGALGARICFDGDSFYQPRQVLTSGLDDLVRAIDDSPLVYTEPNVECTGTPMSYDYTIVFEYPSGTRAVTQQTCRGLALGPYTREGPTGELDKTFLSLLQRQEAASAPTLSPPCPEPSDSPEGTGDLRHVVVARYCAAGSTGPGQVLTQAQLSVLDRWSNELFPGSTTIEGKCDRPAAGWPHLSLGDAWGNRFTMTVACTHRLHPVVLSADGKRLTYPTSLDNRALEDLLRQLAGG